MIVRLSYGKQKRIIHAFFTLSAKFLKLEQLDQDGGVSTDVAGSGVDSTGQAGTYFYTAPEIEQGWPKIDEKVSSCCCLIKKVLVYILSSAPHAFILSAYIFVF